MRGGELGGGIEDPPSHQREHEIAAAIAIGAEDAVETDLAGGAEDGGDVTVRQGAHHGEGVKASRSAGITVPPLSTPRRPSIWASGQSDRLHSVRFRTLPFSR